ncbi:MAG: hypothetical protein B0A82_06750 [Alkalinema sp. CACIAM 70d]|nr:MAG: hypothetical protein B0A82_06750 [Alkalinema sp. CACIAM 70d]
MTVTSQKQLTLEEYLTYDNGTDTRYELVDGLLIEIGNESKINTLIAGFLFSVFLRLGLPSYRIGFKQKVEVTSPHASARDPDLIVHSEESASIGEDASQFCLRLSDPNPLLVIEVASPGPESSDNYQRDYEQKPREYAERGIPEYWIVDAERAWVRVGTLTNDTYQFKTFQGEDRILSPTFPSLALTTEQVLRAGR